MNSNLASSRSRWFIPRLSAGARSCLQLILLLLPIPLAAEPLRLHPQNPHYFLWRGKPTILITSGALDGFHRVAVLRGAHLPHLLQRRRAALDRREADHRHGRGRPARTARRPRAHPHGRPLRGGRRRVRTVGCAAPAASEGSRDGACPHRCPSRGGRRASRHLGGRPRERGALPLPGAQLRESAPRAFRRGDTDTSGSLELTDAVRLLNFLFLGGEAVAYPDAADTNDDGDLNLTDPIVTLSFLFLGGVTPSLPGPATCGPDERPDDLPSCESNCR